MILLAFHLALEGPGHVAADEPNRIAEAILEGRGAPPAPVPELLRGRRSRDQGHRQQGDRQPHLHTHRCSPVNTRSPKNPRRIQRMVNPAAPSTSGGTTTKSHPSSGTVLSK